MDIQYLACPVCKQPLQTKTGTEDDSQTTGEKLFCPSCCLIYTIDDGIPNLLPPHLNDFTSKVNTVQPEKEVKRYYIEKEKYD